MTGGMRDVSHLLTEIAQMTIIVCLSKMGE